MQFLTADSNSKKASLSISLREISHFSMTARPAFMMRTCSYDLMSLAWKIISELCMIVGTEWKLVIRKLVIVRIQETASFLVIEIQKNAITSFISVFWLSQGLSITSFLLRVSLKLVIWVSDKEWPYSSKACS
jgi:hypothetical protein